MTLREGTSLQGGKYWINRVLGQGGFGITYEAEQPLLRRIVAIKEFFMKDCCDRDSSTSKVTIGTGNQKELVEKFRGKFIREAQVIAGMEHPHIVRVTDVFEENGTAYYVMENLTGGSLADKVKKEGPLSEAEAEKYIRQVADALAYIHSLNTVHLDIKPSNILLNAKGDAVLIDFGISKHYDDSGEQTSSTPVGTSKGYAPLEQSLDGDVSQFKPSTDIYSLGATLYYLITGMAPPEATIVNEDGLEYPKGVSDRLWKAIEVAMRPRRKDRPQSISEFLALLDSSSKDKREETEEATIVLSPKQASNSNKRINASSNRNRLPFKPKPLLSLLGVIALAAVVSVFVANLFRNKGDRNVNSIPQLDSSSIVREASKKQQKSAGNKGSLNVISTPSGATIWLDGVNINKTTPALIEDVNIGKHTIELKLKGYDDYSNTFVLNSNERLFISPDITISNAAQVQPQTPQKAQSEVLKKATTGKENGHEWVDLGLSVKWATCNVGASSPNEYGDYFAWGEVAPKVVYSQKSLRYCIMNEGKSTFLKYNTKVDYGQVDNKTRLELSDDVAWANWGGSWRMPTRDELDELISNCEIAWVTQGGVKGFKVSSKKNGGNIFFPAAGYRSDDYVVGEENTCHYWSSSLSTQFPHLAICGIFDSTISYTFYSNRRSDGLPVRPVIE